jgi:hypothetical protein
MANRGARAARAESLFREVNEHTTATTEEALADDAIVVCECDDLSCTAHLHVPLEQYEEVRSEPTHFIIKPGHVDGDVERVVGVAGGYEVVEKDETDAVVVSETLDTRP